VKKAIEKKEKSEEENEDVEEAEGDEEPEGDEELDKTEEQNPKIKIEEPTGIVLGLVSSDLNSERDIIKNKFLEKINILRAKRNAPPVKNISELKESAPPTKRQKRENPSEEKIGRKLTGNLTPRFLSGKIIPSRMIFPDSEKGNSDGFKSETESESESEFE